jgi:hypothetical protein
MLQIQWLFQAEPPTDPRLLALKTTLKTLFEERFLLLVDAAYLYLIDQDLTRNRAPRWDAHRVEVSRVVTLSPYPTHLILRVFSFHNYSTSSLPFSIIFLSSLPSIFW